MVDTRLSKNIESQVKVEWGGHAFFSSYTSQARGVSIFMNKQLPVKIVDTFEDSDGNNLAVLISIDEKKVLIEGIYGPNLDCPTFYSDQLFRRVLDWDPEYVIYAGDWNIVLDPELDCRGYRHQNNPLARTELLNKINEFNLVDIFRHLNPTSRKFTWKKWDSTKAARLDYFLISNSLLPYVNKVETLSSLYSDHCPVILEIDFTRFKRGRGFWKLNNSLLRDSSYVSTIKNIIKYTTCQYAQIDGKEAFFELNNDEYNAFLDEQTPESLQSLELSLNPELFFRCAANGNKKDIYPICIN